MTMTRQEVLEYVLRSNNLPTLPVVASRLITLTGREDTTLADIANLISKDIALSARILKVSNSAFYSFPQKISSINQAVSILGTNAVSNLALSFSFLSMGKGNNKTDFNFKEFWEKSLAGAVAAKLILEQVPDTNTEEIFTSALLGNIGKLIMASTMPDIYDQVLNRLQGYNEQLEIEIEEEIIGVPHYDIGYAVTRHWGFPKSLLLPIKYHNTPQEYSGGDKHISLTINAVYLAKILTHILYSDQPDKWHKLFRSEAKKIFKFKAVTINKILKEVHKLVNQTAEYFDLHMPPAKSVEEILQEANIRLSLLNLSYEEINRDLIDSKMALEKITRELEKKNKFLKNIANIDGLTEINNHRFFQNFLDKEINRSSRNEKTISILLADIDHFKKFNDTYGHQTGDFILKEFCQVCKENIRKYDLIARYGGEEFIFVLPETEPDDAKMIAEKIRSGIENHVFDDDTDTYRVTISIGVASARPTGQDFKKNEFIGLADEAMYQAKKDGRNRVAMYTPNKKKKWFNF